MADALTELLESVYQVIKHIFTKEALRKFIENQVKNVEYHPLDKLDLTSVTDFSGVFKGIIKDETDNRLFEKISTWDVSHVTNMEGMFKDCPGFNLDLSNWNVQKVDNMKAMFKGCTNYNNRIFSLTRSRIRPTVPDPHDMREMFYGCVKFNQNITGWDVAGVKDMSYMFFGCATYNQPMEWDVVSVRNMSHMFDGCERLNQNLQRWQPELVKDMSYMFKDCSVLTETDLSVWNVSSVENHTGMFENCPLAEVRKPIFPKKQRSQQSEASQETATPTIKYDPLVYNPKTGTMKTKSNSKKTSGIVRMNDAQRLYERTKRSVTQQLSQKTSQTSVTSSQKEQGSTTKSLQPISTKEEIELVSPTKATAIGPHLTEKSFNQYTDPLAQRFNELPFASDSTLFPEEDQEQVLQLSQINPTSAALVAKRLGAVRKLPSKQQKQLAGKLAKWIIWMYLSRGTRGSVAAIVPKKLDEKKLAAKILRTFQEPSAKVPKWLTWVMLSYWKQSQWNMTQRFLPKRQRAANNQITVYNPNQTRRAPQGRINLPRPSSKMRLPTKRDLQELPYLMEPRPRDLRREEMVNQLLPKMPQRLASPSTGLRLTQAAPPDTTKDLLVTLPEPEIVPPNFILPLNAEHGEKGTRSPERVELEEEETKEGDLRPPPRTGTSYVVQPSAEEIFLDNVEIKNLTEKLDKIQGEVNDTIFTSNDTTRGFFTECITKIKQLVESLKHPDTGLASGRTLRARSFGHHARKTTQRRKGGFLRAWWNKRREQEKSKFEFDLKGIKREILYDKCVDHKLLNNCKGPIYYLRNRRQCEMYQEAVAHHKAESYPECDKNFLYIRKELIEVVLELQNLIANKMDSNHILSPNQEQLLGKINTVLYRANQQNVEQQQGALFEPPVDVIPPSQTPVAAHGKRRRVTQSKRKNGRKLSRGRKQSRRRRRGTSRRKKA